MSDFTAIGQYVTEAKNLLDSIKGGAIRTMQTQFDALIETLTSRFNGKLIEYQNQVSAITRPSYAVIKSSMAQDLYLDPTNGNDANSGAGWESAFKTLQALINSTPDGAYVRILIVNTSEAAPLVLDETITIQNRDIYLSGYKAAADKHDQYITLSAKKVFEARNGSVTIFNGYLHFNVIGDVSMIYSVFGKAVLNLGGYSGQAFTLNDGASLSFASQHYSYPSGMSEVSLNRVMCKNADGTVTDKAVSLINQGGSDLSTTAIFNIWQSSLGSAFSDGGTVNELSVGVKLVSKRG